MNILTFFTTQTPFKFFIENVWRDEAYSVVLSKQSWIELFFYTAKDFNPPLYYLILKIWMLIFGSSAISIRMISVLCFILFLYVIFLFLKNILRVPQHYTYGYLILFLMNPILQYYAFEARMYMMFVLLSSLSIYTFLKKDIKLYIIFTCAGLYTHYFMVFVIFIEFIHHLITHKKNVFLKHFVYYLYPIIIFIPWIIFVAIYKQFTDGKFWIEKPLQIDFLHVPAYIYTGYERPFNYLIENNLHIYSDLALFSSVLIFAVLAYLLFNKHNRFNSLFVILAVWGLGIPYMIHMVSFIQPIFLPRYLIFTTPGLILLFIYSIEQIPQYLKVSILTVLLFFTFSYGTIQIQHRTRDTFETLFKTINHEAKNGDVVYVTDALFYFVAEYYFKIDKVYIYNIDYGSIPSYTGKSLIPASHVTNMLPPYPIRAFVITGQHEYHIVSQP
ncbi:MAG: glycosyltransferase family 39 protein [Candidatus Roizmanbacteria bacterium]